MGWGGKQHQQVLSVGQTRAERDAPAMEETDERPSPVLGFHWLCCSSYCRQETSGYRGLEGLRSSPNPWTRTVAWEP